MPLSLDRKSGDAKDHSPFHDSPRLDSAPWFTENKGPKLDQLELEYPKRKRKKKGKQKDLLLRMLNMNSDT